MKITDCQGKEHATLREAALADVHFKLDKLKDRINSEKNGIIDVNDSGDINVVGFSPELEKIILSALESD